MTSSSVVGRETDAQTRIRAHGLLAADLQQRVGYGRAQVGSLSAARLSHSLVTRTAGPLRNLPDAERALVGLSRRSGIAFREAASGCSSAIRTSATPNVGSLVSEWVLATLSGRSG
jgi:hypothetical protein